MATFMVLTTDQKLSSNGYLMEPLLTLSEITTLKNPQGIILNIPSQLILYWTYTMGLMLWRSSLDPEYPKMRFNFDVQVITFGVFN